MATGGDAAWIPAALERLLPPNLKQKAGFVQKVEAALQAANIASEEDMLAMTPEQLRAARIPLAAKPYLSQEYQSTVASQSKAAGAAGGSGKQVSGPRPATGGPPQDVLSPKDGAGTVPLAAGDNSELTAEGSLVNVSRGGSELHELVRAGDVEGIQALKASSSDAEWERALCSRDDDTDTPLSLALRCGKEPVAKVLLDLGASRSIFLHVLDSEVLLCTLPDSSRQASLKSTGTELIVDQALESYILALSKGV